MSKIVYDYIDEYIDKTHNKNEPFFTNLRNFAEENHIYIIKPQVEQFLKTFLAVTQPKEILEIGTAIGYSATLMISCVPDAHITTIERDEEVLKIAKDNIKARGAEDKIRCIFGDACEVLENLGGSYDFVFLDAAKGQYQNHFEMILPKIRKGGVIITDDVLYMGMTATDNLATKKHITITRRLREYLTMLCSDERFETSILPIGDGVSVTYIKD